MYPLSIEKTKSLKCVNKYLSNWWTIVTTTYIFENWKLSEKKASFSQILIFLQWQHL